MCKNFLTHGKAGRIGGKTMYQTIIRFLVLTFAVGAQASVETTYETHNMNDDNPAVAQFALEVVKLKLEVAVDKPKISTTSKLRIDLWLVNESPKPFELLLGVGAMESPYWLNMVTNEGADNILWENSNAKLYGKPEKIMVIQPGERYEDTHEVDLGEIKDLKTGTYFLFLNFPIYRYIGGELRGIYLKRRSRPVEIIADPPDIQPSVSR